MSPWTSRPPVGCCAVSWPARDVARAITVPVRVESFPPTRSQGTGARSSATSTVTTTLPSASTTHDPSRPWFAAATPATGAHDGKGKAAAPASAARSAAAAAR